MEGMRLLDYLLKSLEEPGLREMGWDGVHLLILLQEGPYGGGEV